MEKGRKKIVQSKIFKENRRDVYNYGEEAFGELLADLFFERLHKIIDKLDREYDLHPECKALPTKNKIYRNIIFGKYLIIYRITPDAVQLLVMIHCSRSVTKIKSTRSIKI